MNQDLPEPDFSFDCDGTPCYYASTVRRLIKEARDMALEDDRSRGAGERPERRAAARHDGAAQGLRARRGADAFDATALA